MGDAAVPKQATAAGEVIVRGWPQQGPVAPKHLIDCANQPPHASVAGRVDHGSVCSRDYARTDTSLACIHEAEESEPVNQRRRQESTPIPLGEYPHSSIKQLAS